MGFPPKVGWEFLLLLQGLTRTTSWGTAGWLITLSRSYFDLGIFRRNLRCLCRSLSYWLFSWVHRTWFPSTLVSVDGRASVMWKGLLGFSPAASDLGLPPCSTPINHAIIQQPVTYPIFQVLINLLGKLWALLAWFHYSGFLKRSISIVRAEQPLNQVSPAHQGCSWNANFGRDACLILCYHGRFTLFAAL